MKKFFEEFKEFALRGNVVDLTLGIVLGGAFTKIINSFVSDFLMPLIAVITGTVDFSQLKWTIERLGSDQTVVVSYGLLINAIINFIIVALAMFLAIKAMNKLRNKQPVEENLLEKEEVQLLSEIRDLLKEKK